MCNQFTCCKAFHPWLSYLMDVAHKCNSSFPINHVALVAILTQPLVVSCQYLENHKP